MGPSLYTNLVTQDTFNSLVLAIVQKYTDADAKMPMLHKLLLTPEYSVNGTFASISELVNNFMIDVVATDSKLPLKNREKIALLQGYLPKMGNEMYLNEQQLQELDALVQMTGMPVEDILVKLFKDADTLIKGGLLRNEYLFLQGLSTGKASVSDADNVGVTFECDFGFLPDNKQYASVIWGQTNDTPFTDLSNLVSKASNDGQIVSKAFMDNKTFSKLLASKEIKAMFNSVNALPTRKRLEELLLTELGLEVYVVNRTVTAQINGENKTIQAWKEGQITLISDDKVGKLVWTRTAEFNHRVAGVLYQDADGGAFLVSKYGKNNPVAEFTSIQGRCLPVIGNVQNIYQLDTTKISA